MKLPLGLTRALAIMCATMFAFEGMGFAQEQPTTQQSGQAGSLTPQEQPTPQQSGQAGSLTPDQLDTMVAPIALYPDPLISQILVASTYPLELVQANQFIQQYSNLKGQDLAQAAQQQKWDASVQALVAFPDVIKRLNQDITWTTSLGNAFLARQADVMDAIQRMRIKAEQAGKLKSTPQQKVETTSQNGQTVVQVEPTNPAVIYVPVYNPAWIWGPPAYYSYPAWDYPPAPMPDVFLWFAAGVWLYRVFEGCCGWGGWGWSPHWFDHEVIVNNHFMNRYNFGRPHMTPPHGDSPWHHDPFHRLGVAYPNRELNEHFRGPVRPHPQVGEVQRQFQESANRVGPVRPHPQVGEVQRQLQESANRVRPAPIDRIGGHDIHSGVFNRNRTAFGGIEEGTAARVHSDRGFSSMGRARMRQGPSWHPRAPVTGGHGARGPGSVPVPRGHRGGGNR